MTVMEPTHKCSICGALWKLWKVDEAFPGAPASWMLVSVYCGKCCDNVTMGDQMEPLSAEELPTNASIPS